MASWGSSWLPLVVAFVVATSFLVFQQSALTQLLLHKQDNLFEEELRQLTTTLSSVHHAEMSAVQAAQKRLTELEADLRSRQEELGRLRKALDDKDVELRVASMSHDPCRTTFDEALRRANEEFAVPLNDAARLYATQNEELRDSLAQLRQQAVKASGEAAVPLEAATSPIQAPRRSVRILFLTTRNWYDSKMDRFFYTQYETARTHHAIREAVLWGPGWTDYNDSLSLRENLEHRFGRLSYFDFAYLWVTRRSEHLDVMIRDISRDLPTVTRDDECWGSRCSSYFSQFNISVMTFAYPQDMHDYLRFIHRTRRLLVNVPHSADENVFVPLHSKPRDIDVLLTGYRLNETYPLRERLARLISQGVLPGNTKIRIHPGYNEFAAPDLKEQHNNVTLAEQLNDYARDLQRSKIVICTTSVFRYSLRKYVEAALAGALVLGNVPTDREDEFLKYVVPVSMDDSDDRIRTRVKWWLDHDEEREAKARLGQYIAERYYSNTAALDLLVHSFLRWRGGRTGLYFPFPFSLACAAEKKDRTTNQPAANKLCACGGAECLQL